MMIPVFAVNRPKNNAHFCSALFFALTFFCHGSFAQLPGTGGGDPFKVNIIPPSPEAAALAKYADIPVSLYSGTPQISIPLYEINERELKLSVALNYHASGNKVETIAPRTGLSWTLDAGGVVTRSVRGWPDEYGTKGFLYQAQQHDVGDYALGTPEQQYQWYDAMAEGCLDAEPDLFYFNVAGYTGTFMFDWDGSLQVMSGNSIKIEPFGFTVGELDFIDGWKITVEDGTTFLFQAIETTEVIEANVGISCRLALNDRFIPQSWFLTEMRSANQTSWIRFEYDTYTQQTEMWSMETQTHNAALSPAPALMEKLKIIVSGQNLKRILTSSGQCVMEFLPGEQRTDIDGSTVYTLGQIDVKNINNKQIRHVDLYYDYSTGRLTLKRLVESANGTTLPPYEFTYTGSLPGVHSYNRDHWGFFNSNNAATLIPATTVNSPLHEDPVELSGGDRSPDPGRVKAGMISQITYPSGGKDVFTFESHDFSFLQNDELEYEITIPRSINDYAPTSDTPSGVRYTNSQNFTLNATTDVRLTAGFGFGVIFGGGAFGAEFWIENSAGTTIYGLAPGGSPGESKVFTKTLYDLPPGTYTLTVSGRMPFRRGDPDNPQYPNSVSVILDWDEGTGVIATEMRQGGGVRIARITRSFGNGNPDKVTKYSYHITEGGRDKSSGSLLESGKLYEIWTQYAVPLGPGAYTTESKFLRFAQSKSALGTTHGSHVGYSHVTVSYGENGENGHSIYHYTSSRDLDFTDYASYEIPFPPPYSRDYKRGLLLDQTDYQAGSDTPVKRITQKHTYHAKDIWGIKVGMAIAGGGPRGPGFLNRYAVGSYSSPLGYTRLRERRETIFQPNAPPIETVTTYEYNETTHKQVVTISATDSKGETLVTAFKYPHDYTGSSTLLLMKNRNMASSVVEKLTWKKGAGIDVYLSSGVKTEFTHSLSNKVTPHIIHGAKIVQPVITNNPFGTVQNYYETRLHLTSHDAYGNLREHASANGLKTSYQWNNAGTLLTAKVENAMAGQIFYESFEDNATVSAQEHKTGRQSKFINGIYTVPSANRPDSNGEYILSYWIKEGGGPWTYKEKLIQYTTASTAISTDVVNGFLDEIRVHPRDAHMTTYTYDPLIGITSITGPGNVTTYYEYDAVGRLTCIRDQDNNIMQCYDYGFRLEVPYPVEN